MNKGIRMMCAGVLAVSVLAGSAVYAEGNPYVEMEPAELMKAYHEANQYDEYLQEKYIMSDICFELDGFTKHVIMGPNDYCYYSLSDKDGTDSNDEVSVEHVTYGYRVDIDGKEFYKIKIYDETLWEYERALQLTYMPIDIYMEEAEIVNIQDVDGATSFTFIYPINDEKRAYLEELGMSSEEAAAVQTIEENVLTEKGGLRTERTQMYAVTADRKILYDTTTFAYLDTFDNHEREAELSALVYDGEETHTVTLTVAPGTENEKVYTVTANKDVLIDTWVMGSDGTYDIYTDEACTIPYEGLVGGYYVPVSEDATLYMK